MSTDNYNSGWWSSDTSGHGLGAPVVNGLGAPGIMPTVHSTTGNSINVNAISPLERMEGISTRVPAGDNWLIFQNGVLVGVEKRNGLDRALDEIKDE